MDLNWQHLLFFIGGGLMLFLVYRSYKARPEMFSKANFGKSLSTMGLLALGLIAFIYILILLLRQG